VALQLGKEGASLVLHGVESTEQLQQAANLIMKEGGVPAGNILQVVGDMEDEQVPEKIISETVAKFGRIDVLVRLCFSRADTGTGHSRPARAVLGVRPVPVVPSGGGLCPGVPSGGLPSAL
jgi:hypothetical protein